MVIPAPPSFNPGDFRDPPRFLDSCPSMETFRDTRSDLKKIIEVQPEIVRGPADKQAYKLNCIWRNDGNELMQSSFTVPITSTVAPLKRQWRDRVTPFRYSKAYSEDQAKKLCATTVILYRFFATGEQPSLHHAVVRPEDLMVMESLELSELVYNPTSGGKKPVTKEADRAYEDYLKFGPPVPAHPVSKPFVRLVAPVNPPSPPGRRVSDPALLDDPLEPDDEFGEDLQLTLGDEFLRLLGLGSYSASAEGDFFAEKDREGGEDETEEDESEEGENMGDFDEPVVTLSNDGTVPVLPDAHEVSGASGTSARAANPKYAPRQQMLRSSWASQLSPILEASSPYERSSSKRTLGLGTPDRIH